MFFTIKGKLKIMLPEKLINDTVKELVFGLLYRSVSVEYVPHEQTEILIGDAEKKPFCGESVYNITPNGIYVGGKDERALLTALFILLQDAEPECLTEGKELIKFSCQERQIDTGIERRMIHYCVVPRVPLSVYKKLIRVAGVLGFTHIILEVFGNLQFDALQELSWKNESFTKEQVSQLINEARNLMMEPIPMFQHFAHAGAGGIKNGKHVVLDQNPRLSTLFSSDGWEWRFDKAEVKDLLKKVRNELIELFGPGEFFHVGFDEGFSYPNDEDSTERLCEYIKYLCEEIKQTGRTPLFWGDMFLHEPTVGIEPGTGYEGNCQSFDISEKMIKSFPDYAIMCDWQYFVKQAPWKSAKYFKDKGVKTIVCSWTNPAGAYSAIKTAKELSCYAYMMTTWDTLYSDIDALAEIMEVYYHLFGINKAVPKADNALNRQTLFRKLFFADGEYDKAGFTCCGFKNIIPELKDL